jgi:hypothetical protein
VPGQYVLAGHTVVARSPISVDEISPPEEER